MIYDKIHEFCKVRNRGNCFKNGENPTPRVEFLLNLLDSEGIKYELDSFIDERDTPKFDHPSFDRLRNRKNEELIFTDEDEYHIPNKGVNNFFNIILKGSSSKMVVAHHDINNPNSDNANDNSCSVINAIALKKLRPDINVVLLDGEEFGGIGSKRLATRINNGDFGSIEWVLNFELTGLGGKNFFIGNYPGKLFNHIKSIFDCPVVSTPFNDSVILRKYGIDSVVINPLPPTKDNKMSDVLYGDTYLDISILYKCHSPHDSVDKMSTSDMKEFVEDVVLKII
jgi:hypothetical protein